LARPVAHYEFDFIVPMTISDLFTRLHPSRRIARLPCGTHDAIALGSALLAGHQNAELIRPHRITEQKPRQGNGVLATGNSRIDIWMMDDG
jgi:hypothetical protein